MVAKLVLLAANKCMKREILKAIGLGKMDICSCTVPEKSTIPEEVISKMDAYIEASKHPQRHNWKMFRQFYDALKKGVVLQQQKCWVHHLKPYEIKISGRSLATQLLEGGRYSSTVCDAILRDQIQCEDKAFSETEKRQRHLMPASFLHSYRERRCISNVEQLRVFFYGDHVKYKVSECIQINMPVPIRRKWSCYSWNLIDRTLTVLDPVLMKGDISIIKQTHEEIVSELRTAMISCLDAFYPDYTTKASDWKIIYRNDISEKCKWCDSGLYSLHYALNFNTDALTEEINWEDDFIGRWRSVWNIISMEGNIGVKPERFLEIENDEESE